MSTETEALLAALAQQAKDSPGRLVTGHTTADQQHLAREAARLRREADRLDGQANQQGSE